MFLTASILCLLAMAVMVVVGFLAPNPRVEHHHHRRAVAKEAPDPPPFGEVIRRIVRSEAIYSLIVIMLFACLFTSFSQFQTTFAADRQLDFSVFYITYTLAVISSRFGLAHVAARFDPKLVLAVSVSVLVLSVAAFLVVGSNAVLYGGASAFVGLSYGLALPTVQAQAVNVADETTRPRVLPLAGLLFQAAILGFPVIAGRIIAGWGYPALFAVLVTFAFIQAILGWWRLWASKKGANASSRRAINDSRLG